MNEEQNAGELFGPDVINTDAIDALTPEQIQQALDILTKAGY
jgi:hypothetical protein